MNCRRFLSALVCVLVFLSLAACGSIMQKNPDPFFEVLPGMKISEVTAKFEGESDYSVFDRDNTSFSSSYAVAAKNKASAFPFFGNAADSLHIDYDASNGKIFRVRAGIPFPKKGGEKFSKQKLDTLEKIKNYGVSLIDRNDIPGKFYDYIFQVEINGKPYQLEFTALYENDGGKSDVEEKNDEYTMFFILEKLS